jgi:hypothetical protein
VDFQNSFLPLPQIRRRSAMESGATLPAGLLEGARGELIHALSVLYQRIWRGKVDENDCRVMRILMTAMPTTPTTYIPKLVLSDLLDQKDPVAIDRLFDDCNAARIESFAGAERKSTVETFTSVEKASITCLASVPEDLRYEGAFAIPGDADGGFVGVDRGRTGAAMTQAKEPHVRDAVQKASKRCEAVAGEVMMTVDRLRADGQAVRDGEAQHDAALKDERAKVDREGPDHGVALAKREMDDRKHYAQCLRY